MSMDWDRVVRLLGAETMAFLRQQQVALIGLGSGGGFVAQGLAMSGVSRFVLIDEDELEAHNIVRHVADSRDIGRSKAEVVRDLILHRNPDAQIRAVQGSVEDHPHLLDGVDLVVSAVDSEGAKYLINEICLQKGLPAIYAGVYERGEGGDVAVIIPEAGPCYACWADNLRQGIMSPRPDGSGDLDYGLINEKGTLDAEPGLWLHVVRVAATQADMALNLLLRDTPAYRPIPGNTVILANAELEIIEGHLTPPYSAEWVTIKRNPACLVCGRYQNVGSESLSLEAVADDMLISEEETSANSNKGHAGQVDTIIGPNILEAEETSEDKGVL